MPRSRLAASRQTQLGQKKKRHGKGPAGAATQESPPTTGGEAGDTGAEAQMLSQTPTLAPASQPYIQRPAERASVYNHVGAEAKRILALSGGVLALLIVLSFILR